MTDLTQVGMTMVLLGFTVVFVAVAASARGPRGDDKGTEVRGGGVVMVGPVPIVFGSDAKWASIAVLLAIALIVLVLLSGVSVR
ncbi:MAG: DUF131 domain-containing protein [Nitrososphaerota archaeon]|nr:DUF131 domain-containing protein [Nitrososphaerota archaeon]MDG6966156.1 DUF131 domain-containing protein [Nitrososphaerota archaeon]MDG6977591.1 DUF131 domain-containing protein [Nitrososphaerota archaeon]MDG7020345.1 DUF131 domain-containing protein [Nitrososphaerota archaeon]